MREGRTRKYLIWFAMLTVLLGLPVSAFVLFGSELVGYLQYVPIFGMELSSGVLMLTALMGMLAADDDTKIPKWEIAVFVYGVIGFSLALYLTVFTELDSFLLLLYIPGATAALNVGLTFLVQTWTANRNLGLPFWQVMPAHALFALWTFGSLVYSADTAFIIISAVLVLAVAVIMLPIEMLIDWREQNKLKSLGKIYS
jgi:hypothetical protein